jgi:hypothetical protein
MIRLLRLALLCAASLAALLAFAAPALANDPPTCDNRSYSTASGQPYALPLDSCTDPEGGSLSYSLVTGPSHGSIQPIPGGGFAYVPASGYTGPDSFTYRATDFGGAQSNVATVSFTVVAGSPNAPPSCPASGPFSVGSGQGLNLPTCTDDYSNRIFYSGSATNGTFSVVGGVPRYRSNPGYTGPDTVTYTATDLLSASSSPVVVSINVDPSLPANQQLACPDSQAFVPLGQSIVLHGNCADPDGDPIGYSIATLPTHGTLNILSLTSAEYTPDGTSMTDSFSYGASDGVHTPLVVNVPITVLPAGSNTFPPVTPVPSTADPFVASVQVPVTGSVAIDARTTTAVPPTGYSLLGQEFDITYLGPDASAADPLRITFGIDASVTDPSIVPIRDGVPVAACTDPSGTTAAPDPCFEPVVGAVGSDRSITVRTSHASLWTLGVSADVFDFSGFFSPVDNRPWVNSAVAGQAVPVKFSLGGDEGLDIFADGYPKSQTMTCNTEADLDGIESTVSASSSGLKYDPATATYTYVWKTDKSWTGCRQLVLRFNDGADTTMRADFSFKAK